MSDKVLPGADLRAIPGPVLSNPDNAAHFMWVRSFAQSVDVRNGGRMIARSINPVRIIEVTPRDVLAPAIYLPRDAISGALRQNEKRTMCPLKGEAVYFDLEYENGTNVCTDIAWSYPAPHRFASEIAGLVSFDTNKVTCCMSPVDG